MPAVRHRRRHASDAIPDITCHTAHATRARATATTAHLSATVHRADPDIISAMAHATWTAAPVARSCPASGCGSS